MSECPECGSSATERIAERRLWGERIEFAYLCGDCPAEFIVAYGDPEVIVAYGDPEVIDVTAVGGDE